MEKRYQIALFTCHLDNAYSNRVISGCQAAAKDYDANLFIFPVRTLNAIYDYVIHTKYEYQYNNMFHYAEGQNFDAVIVETGTVGSFVEKSEMEEILKRFSNIPVVTIAGEVKGFPCARFAKREFKQIVLHLIRQHNCTKIGYVGGPATNQDAIDRLDSYKEALEMEGIPFNEKYVAEGDFSEYSTGAVADLLDSNPEGLDAICFANDRMAIGGYEEIQQRGLVIGKDILVTGFDDAASAVSMRPPLTTVRADCSELGYQAFEECMEMIHGAPQQPIITRTQLVCRDSCGCRVQLNVPDNRWKGTEEEKKKEMTRFMDEITAQYFWNCKRHHKEQALVNRVQEFVKTIFYYGEAPSENLKSSILQEEKRLLQADVFDSLSIEEIDRVFISVCEKAIQMNGEESAIRELYTLINKCAVKFYYDTSYYYKDKMKKDIRLANTIMDNMLVYDFDVSNSYQRILADFVKMGIRTSYFFFHKETISSNQRDDWELPEKEYLLFYQENGKYVEPTQRAIETNQLFRCRYFPKERFTFVVSPLFFGTENYGLIACSMEPENFYYYSYIVVPQVAYAIKYYHVIREQISMRENLQENLNQEKNMNLTLTRISKFDELTGLLNRRGFMENMQSELDKPENEGKEALVVFADLDNLKKINDIYGHSEGDFALCLATSILRKCFLELGSVARFGGDEFVTFLFVENEDCKAELINQIETITEAENQKSLKPYYVELSVGCVEFKCTSQMSIHELLKVADDALYIDKLGKRQDISKILY